MERNINGILESALYFPDLSSASEFYKDLFRFEVLLSSEWLVTLRSVAGKQVLLLFQEESFSYRGSASNRRYIYQHTMGKDRFT